MKLQKQGELSWLESELLKEIDLTHGWFTRYGGVSARPFNSLNTKRGFGDPEKNVLENRRRAVEALGKNISDLVWMRCVHGADLVYATSEMKGTDPKCDAIIASQPQLVIGMGTADCGSLIISEPNKSFAALVHAGWKGLGTGIIPQTIVRLSNEFSVKPEDFVVGSGPLACGACYEFGPEATELFDKKYITKPEGKLHLDMRAMILDELHASGVRKIDDSGICTMEDERFFSYRRDSDPSIVGGFGIFPAFTSL